MGGEENPTRTNVYCVGPPLKRPPDSRGARSSPGVKAVPDPRLGKNVAGVRLISFDLFSQLPDEHAQIFGLFAIVCAPDSVSSFRESAPFPACRIRWASSSNSFGVR